MGDAVEECKALAERLGAPVVTGYLRNDAFPASHPLWAGPLGYQGSKAAMKLMAQADVVIALGSAHGPLRHPAAARHGLLAQGARSSRSRPTTPTGPGEEDLGRHLRRRQGRRRRADQAPAGQAPWPATPPRRERAATIAAEKAAWEKELDDWTHEKRPFSLDMIDENGKEKTFNGGSYLHPRQVLRELEKAMPPASWCPPTSATSTRWPTATCASKSRAASSRR
jgi:sulfoacetaldehyde acetyltransferase